MGVRMQAQDYSHIDDVKTHFAKNTRRYSGNFTSFFAIAGCSLKIVLKYQSLQHNAE